MYRTIVRVTRNVRRNAIRHHISGSRAGGMAKSNLRSNFQCVEHGQNLRRPARVADRMVPDSPDGPDSLVVRHEYLAVARRGWLGANARLAAVPAADRWRRWPGRAGGLLGHTPYRIDIDVYRMGGRAWLDGRPLYADGAMFHTRGRSGPAVHLSAAGRGRVRAVRAGCRCPRASVAITLITLLLLVVVDGDRADPAGGVADSSHGHHRARLAAARLAGGGDRRARGRLPGADPVELRLRPDQRGADDAGDRRLRAAPDAVAARPAARRCDRAQAHPCGVPAVLPAAPRHPRAAGHRGVGGGRHPGRFRVGLAGLVRVLDRDRARHRPDRHRDAEHQPEHRGHAGPARPRRGRAVRAVGAGLLRGAGADGVGGAPGAAGRIRRLRRASGEATVLALVCVAMFGLVVSPVSWSHHWVWVLPTVAGDRGGGLPATATSRLAAVTAAGWR